MTTAAVPPESGAVQAVESAYTETTPTGISIEDCATCNHRHPVSRKHCPTCGLAHLFPCTKETS